MKFDAPTRRLILTESELGSLFGLHGLYCEPLNVHIVVNHKKLTKAELEKATAELLKDAADHGVKDADLLLRDAMEEINERPLPASKATKAN